MTTTATPRSMTAGDLDAVMAMNEAAVPAVSRVDAAALAALHASSALALVVDGEQGPLGFALLFEEGADYASLNYRWFHDRHPAFLYMDRIVVVPEAVGRGLGRALYRHAAPRAARRGVALCCEVNLEPPNPESLAFHHRLGFQIVGEQGEPGSGKRVAMMAHTAPGELVAS